jgi:hypothetical protein
MSCERFRSALGAVAAGEEMPGELAAHLPGCLACREALETERQRVARIDREVQAALDVAPSAALLARVREQLAQEPRSEPRLWRGWLAIAATVSVALISGVVILWRESSPPESPKTTADVRPAHVPPPAPIPEPQVVPPVFSARSVHMLPRPAPGAGEPEVLIASQEREALRRYMEEYGGAAAGQASLPVGLDPPGPRPIDVFPLAVPPLALSAAGPVQVEIDPIRIASIGVLPLTMDSGNKE